MSVRSFVAAMAVVGTLGTASVAAQEPLRAGVLGSPTIGRAAPEVVLPYFTSLGPGPTDQPFRLGAELGRVVILVFGGKADSAAADDWASIKARTDSLVGRNVVAAGLLRAGPDRTLEIATGLPDFKLLADKEGRAHRTYGISESTRSWSIFVVGDDGRLVWGGRISARGSDGWAAVRAAVARGHTAG
jgi:hypothetical protein